MAWVSLSFAPGFYANGTLSQATGRWFDGSLVRFFAGAVRPWGGWVQHSTTPLDGKARSILAWTDNSGVDWIAAGASSKLYALNRVGDVFDITPTGMTAGIADAAVGGGFGFGDFGGGDYGESPVDEELIQVATVVSLDTFGENLIGVSSADGRLFKWERDTDPGGEAAVVSAAPTNNRALVVDETGHILLLGSGGDRRRVAWCDAQDETNWTPGLPSEAGNFPLQTGGSLMCGKRVRGGTLLLTDLDAWLAIYNGGANPFAFEQVGKGCGAVSHGAMVEAGTGLAAWMGESGFWLFDGSVQSISCDVLERVFGDFSRVRASQVTGYHKAEFAEITWHYASSEATDNDRYVTWNYREGHWSTGALARTCGTDAGAFPYPLKIDPDGIVWRHETGFDYGGDEAWIESGPAQFAAEGETPGERVFTALDLIPDESALGAVEATFFTRLTLNGAEEAFGPYPAAEPTNVRFTARHARMRLTGQGGDWRVGSWRMDITLGGTR